MGGYRTVFGRWTPQRLPVIRAPVCTGPDHQFCRLRTDSYRFIAGQEVAALPLAFIIRFVFYSD
jgi:hypothetical protein